MLSPALQSHQSGRREAHALMPVYGATRSFGRMLDTNCFSNVGSHSDALTVGLMHVKFVPALLLHQGPEQVSVCTQNLLIVHSCWGVHVVTMTGQGASVVGQ